jgi:hypothetical protein
VFLIIGALQNTCLCMGGASNWSRKFLLVLSKIDA